MAKSKLVKANEKIEKGVVGIYKNIENSVVGAYKRIEDKFVDSFLTKEGEPVEDAKKEWLVNRRIEKNPARQKWKIVPLNRKQELMSVWKPAKPPERDRIFNETKGFDSPPLGAVPYIPFAPQGGIPPILRGLPRRVSLYIKTVCHLPHIVLISSKYFTQRKT